ncbi:MAG TPA: hypothetical protein VI112_17560 [Bacteroidia bacterium]|jgi:hypothetical protein
MEPFVKEEMTTIVSCMNTLQSRGFTENFVAKENGLEAPSTKKIYSPAAVKIVNFYRFEGESDPADNSILYAIETNDGVKGLLIDSYGHTANPKISKFIADVQEMEKTRAK